jgi:hypothetical protein
MSEAEPAVLRFHYSPPGRPKDRLIEARPEALSFQDEYGRTTELPWTEITSIGADGCWLDIRCHDRRFQVGYWSAPAALEVSRKLRGYWHTIAPLGQASPEQIAEWLGIEPDGALRCDVLPWLWLVFFGGLAFSIAIFVWDFPSFAFSLVGWVMQFTVYSGLALLGLTRVRADVDGLTVRRFGRRRYYAWSEIDGIGKGFWGTVVRTTRGQFTVPIHLPGSQRLLTAIGKVIAAREQGWRLPSTAPVSDTALSRLTGEAEVSERGLSVAEGRGDG